MESSVKTVAASSLALLVAVLWLAIPGAADSHRSAGGGQQPAAAQPSSEHVGDAVCLSCHEGQTKGYYGSAHGRRSNSASPIAKLGCESCHGPGKAHADSGGDTTRIRSFKPRGAKASASSAAIDAPCLQCHGRGDRALWEGSAHEAANLACTRCHSVHAAKAADGLLRATVQTEVCEPCHRSQVQKLHRSSHMPVQESALECSSCHNPHGTRGVKLLKVGSTVNEACASCHADKRGPYLWEHEPVAESCTTCHDPHGSTNDRMLVAKEPFLCQRCHVTSQHPATIYDTYALANSTTANRMSGRSCAACHQNVHGSNAPSGKAFLR